MLYFLSIIFKFFVCIKNYLYDNKYLKTLKLPVPVISVGNLSMGGAGKTPLVDYLVKYLLKNKKAPAILSRGYGRISKGIQLVNSSKKNAAAFFGDEAYMLYSKHNIHYAVGKNRWKAGKHLLNKERADCFVLDDAFQHRKIFRDINIVLLDVSQPKNFYQAFPKGRLRESYSSLKRADIILFTKVNLISQERLSQFKKNLSQKFCFKNILSCDVGYYLTDVVSGNGKKIDKSKPTVLLSGIANPSVFEKSVVKQNFLIQKHFMYKDHFLYTEKEVNSVLAYCLDHGINQVLCTEKDWHKLKEFLKWKDFLFYIKLEVQFVNNEDLFLSKVNGL